MSMLNEETTSDKIIRLVREHVRENDGNGQIVCEPREPNPQDCCGQSCIPCVFDIHREDVLRWAKECAKTISYEGTNLYTYIYHDEVKCDTENSENAFSTKNYKNFKITAITQLSPDTNLYAFEIKDEVPNVLLGSYLRARIANGSQYISRKYTPTFVSQKEFNVPIKIYRGGRMTDKVKDWSVGDLIEWSGPYKDTTEWEKLIAKKLLLMAAGTGIAPFIRIVDKFLNDTNCETIIRLVYCVRSESDILFKQKLVKWAQHWNITVIICGSKIKNANIPYLFSCIPERLTKITFKQQLMMLCGQAVEEVQVAVCGNTTFEKDLVNFSNRAGISSKRISRFQI